MKTILFVCTQNVFRSLSAEYLLRAYLDEHGISDYEVESAGTQAHSWEQPYSQTLDCLYELGVDARDHKNRQLNEDIILKADLIICMSKHHQDIVEQEFDRDSYLFNEIAYGHKTDLQDDVEGDFTILEDFIRAVVYHIHEGIPSLVDNLDEYM